jgi:hypothetical protein
MKPYNTGGNKENCSPVSSNCVIWQGPDLPCLNLCKGDSVSDVVYKTAVEICEIKEVLNLSDLDFTCLLDICDCCNVPPDPDLKSVLQYLIDKICCIYEQNTNTGFKPSGDCCYEEPILTLPACLQYNDPTTGLPVTQLVLSQFASRVAQKLCDINSTVVIHTTQIANLDTRVTVLENAPCCYTPPTVTPSCTYGALPSGVPTQMNLLLQELQSQFCTLVANVGSSTQISNAAQQQCTALGSANALSSTGTMSSLAGWNSTINTFAQSMQNLWITVCDMRDAIVALKNCCSVDCSAFILGFTNVQNPARTEITLFFNALTVIPPGYSNCPSQSIFRVSDSNGATYQTSFDFATAATNPAGITFNFAANGLNPLLPYTVEVEACITDGTNVCQRDTTITLPAATSTTTTSTTTSTTSTSTTSSTSTSTSSTTTTTTIANAATIQLFGEDDGSGNLIVTALVLSGTTLNNITFDGIVRTYSDPFCGITISPELFMFTLNAGNATANSGSLGALGGTQTTKIASLNANALPVSASPQVVTIGGNNYTIIGYDICNPV